MVDREIAHTIAWGIEQVRKQKERATDPDTLQRANDFEAALNRLDRARKLIFEEYEIPRPGEEIEVFSFELTRESLQNLSFSESLVHVRRSKGMTIEDVHEATRIKIPNLRSYESFEANTLPQGGRAQEIISAITKGDEPWVKQTLGEKLRMERRQRKRKTSS